MDGTFRRDGLHKGADDLTSGCRGESDRLGGVEVGGHATNVGAVLEMEDGVAICGGCGSC